VESTEENRRAYREMLFKTPGMEDFISGVILYDETLRHATQDRVPFVKLLSQKGIIPGIKVDKGAKYLAGFVGEKITKGLYGLRDRLIEYEYSIYAINHQNRKF
jgi:fructose-bisphosphate aldolase class I